jgi:hypothetical protein
VLPVRYELGFICQKIIFIVATVKTKNVTTICCVTWSLHSNGTALAGGSSVILYSPHSPNDALRV